MIRVVMFDLGETLVGNDDRPFPHVKEALATIAEFKTADGEPLRSCLVSDFGPANPPIPPAQVAADFDEYLRDLDGMGLRPFFEPVDKRVTLSTHAEANKPDRKVFEKALQRLGANISLEECLLITENATHVKKVRKNLGMKALLFRKAGSNQFDFEDWADAPALVANLVAQK